MKSGPRRGFRWTRETVLYAITLWHRKYGRAPYTHEWDSAGENHPSRPTVNRIFGSWNAAMEEAGFNPRPQGRPRNIYSLSALAARRVRETANDELAP